VPAATLKPTAVRWPVPAALALAPLVLGVLVSFSSDHSARYGLVVLGLFAVVTAAACVLGAVLLRGGPRLGATLKAVVGLGGGVFALVMAGMTDHGTDEAAKAALLAWTVLGILGLCAVIDIWLGVVRRRQDRFGRDWLTLGVLEAVVAVAVMLVPSGYAQQYTVTDKTLPPIDLELNASVMVVGLLGAGLAIIGVYLAIAAVSLMSGRKRADQHAEVTA